MSVYAEPSESQAEMLALLLYAGIPAIEAIPFVAPEVDGASWPELVRRWPKTKPVLDARVRLQGGQWTALDDPTKVQKAIEQAHRCQAWIVASQHPGDLAGGDLTKWKDSLLSLEKVQAGTSGKADAVSQFLEQFQKKLASGEVVVKAKAATH